MPDHDTPVSSHAAAAATKDSTDETTPVITDAPTASEPEPDPEYVALKDIFVNGVRAYNEGDGVYAGAVKKLGLDKDFVKKV